MTRFIPMEPSSPNLRRTPRHRHQPIPASCAHPQAMLPRPDSAPVTDSISRGECSQASGWEGKANSGVL